MIVDSKNDMTMEYDLPKLMVHKIFDEKLGNHLIGFLKQMTEEQVT